MAAPKGAEEPIWSEGRATANRATREAIGLRVEHDGAFYLCIHSSPEDTPELTGTLEADMTDEQVRGMLAAVRTPLGRRWPFSDEPATHAIDATTVHYQLRAPWGVIHGHELPDKQVFVTVHGRKDQEWLVRVLEEGLRVLARTPRRVAPKPQPAPMAEPAKSDGQPGKTDGGPAPARADVPAPAGEAGAPPEAAAPTPAEGAAPAAKEQAEADA